MSIVGRVSVPAHCRYPEAPYLSNLYLGHQSGSRNHGIAYLDGGRSGTETLSHSTLFRGILHPRRILVYRRGPLPELFSQGALDIASSWASRTLIKYPNRGSRTIAYQVCDALGQSFVFREQEFTRERTPVATGGCDSEQFASSTQPKLSTRQGQERFRPSHLAPGSSQMRDEDAAWRIVDLLPPSQVYSDQKPGLWNIPSQPCRQRARRGNGRPRHYQDDPGIGCPPNPSAAQFAGGICPPLRE